MLTKLAYKRHLIFFTDTQGKLLREFLPEKLRNKEIIATSGVGTKLNILGMTLVRFNLAVAFRDGLTGKDRIMNIRINKRYNNND